MLPPGHIHHRQLGLGSQNLTPPRQPSALLSLDHAPWTEAKARLLPRGRESTRRQQEDGESPSRDT